MSQGLLLQPKLAFILDCPQPATNLGPVVSSQVLDSLARVLNLSAAERNHLFVLARDQVPTETYPLTTTIGPRLQDILDAITTCPAYVVNPRLDIIGWNRMMNSLFSDFDTSSPSQGNILRAMFTDPSQRTLICNWEKEARETLALFRTIADRYVQEVWFKALVTELEIASSEFREWWSQHDIQLVYTGQKELNHPRLGRLALQSNMFGVVAASDLHMVVYTDAEAETAKKLAHLNELMEV